MALPSSRTIQVTLIGKGFNHLPTLPHPLCECTRRTTKALFSTSQTLCKKDNNKNRGVSAVRGTGIRRRQTLSIRQRDFAAQQLPKPVPIAEEIEGTPEHGLWGFFKDKKLLQTPLDESRHGRAWTVGELRGRNWETLHELWWVCVKDRNRLATEKIERKRLKAGYGDRENEDRDRTIQTTMKAIADTLAERQLAYAEAVELAKSDPDIDLTRTDGPQYSQAPYDLYEEEDPTTNDIVADSTRGLPSNQETSSSKLRYPR